jgi:hypothetical protein
MDQYLVQIKSRAPVLYTRHVTRIILAPLDFFPNPRRNKSSLLPLSQVTMADSSNSGAAAGAAGASQPKAAPKPPNPVFKMMGMPL